MHATAHGDTIRQSALEAVRNIRVDFLFLFCRISDSNPRQYCVWLFRRTLYPLSYPALRIDPGLSIVRRHLCFLFVCFFALLPKQQCCQIHQCGPFIQKHPSIITTYFSRLTHSRVAVRLIFSACSSCPFVGQTLVVLFVCLFACFVAKTTILPSTSVWAAYSETSIHRYNMPPAQSFTRR